MMMINIMNTAKDCSRLTNMTVPSLSKLLTHSQFSLYRSIDKTKVKDMIEENKEILPDETFNRLFGEKFYEGMVEFVKLKKKSKYFNVLEGENKTSTCHELIALSWGPPF